MRFSSLRRSGGTDAFGDSSARQVVACLPVTSTQMSDAIGISGPRYEFIVERGKIREFARATCADHPAYLLDQMPVVPPTFLTIAGRFWGYTFDLPGETPLAAVQIDRSLLLNAEEEFEFGGDLPRAGMRLWGQTRIKDIYTKQGKRGGLLTFVVVETQFHDDAGLLVATQRQTLVKTEKPPETGP